MPNPNDSLLNMATNLQTVPIYDRWDKIIGYSTAFDNLARLSNTVRAFLCRPSHYFYFRDALCDTMLAVRRQALNASKEDIKILRKLYRDFVSGEYEKFINTSL